MTPADDMTGACREDDSPSESDAGHQLLRHRPASTRSDAGNAAEPSTRSQSPADAQHERNTLIQGLSDPRMYHRHRQFPFHLQDLILALRMAKRAVDSADVVEDWQRCVAMAIKGAERAWEAFIGPLSSMNRRQYVRAGDSAGIRKEDERSRIAVEHRLLVVGNAKDRCISAIQQMCRMKERAWSPIRGALLDLEYTKALAGLNDFESLLRMIDRSLKREIDRVVKDVVARAMDLREDDEEGHGVDDAAPSNR
ncbi:hypothetical protein QFC24_006734 [Naganishia onofrii]|uniref:Uncharacterized protein n=1 Tax=Naganishia onofrii TaxID=1851511 RepID=A0ACC2X0A8_9TREE|nr:hypothetical protein QFC24_006734 [Naganishia onofrii]